MATSQELYENQLMNQRYGMTYGKTDDLIAAVQSGAMTVEEAFPATGPSDPRMSFGGSNLTQEPMLSTAATSVNVPTLSLNDPRISPDTRRPAETTTVDPLTVLASGGLTGLPAPVAGLPLRVVVDQGLADRPLASDQEAIDQQNLMLAQQQAAEEQLAQQQAEQAQLQNFVQMLQQLGLFSLIPTDYTQQPTTGSDTNLFTGAPHSLVPQGGLMGTTPFGVAPSRIGYVPPKVIDSSSVAADTGLLQYILNQGQ